MNHRSHANTNTLTQLTVQGSGEFALAMLNSVLYRSVAMVFIPFAILIASVVTLLVMPEDSSVDFSLLRFSVFLAFIGYEVAVLYAIVSARRRGLQISNKVWAANLIVECSLPTALIILVWSSGALPPHQALAAPVLLSYTLFITLSILHLSAGLTAVAGLTSVVQYAGLLIVAFRNGHLELSTGALPNSFYVFFVMMMIACTLGSAFIATRVRLYVINAVAEATQRLSVEQELAVAGSIQRSLLPKKMLSIPGFTVEGWTRAADESGGDYFDWIEFEGGEAIVSVADVAGHGLGPSLIAAFCRAYARSVFKEHQSLDDALPRINSLIMPDLKRGMFVTFVAMRLDPKSETVDLLSAGHGPILHYRSKTKAVEKRIADLFPLGVDPDLKASDLPKLDLEPGDVVLLITDGFFEWMNSQGVLFGTERLCSSFARACEGETGEIIPSMLADLEQFAEGTIQKDDITAVVIRRDGV